MEQKIITCPDCGAEMVLRRSKKFVYSNGKPRPFWGCSRWPDCTAAHGAHPDGRPLGIPADRLTKQARIRAHDEFDKLWKDGAYRRKEAYAILAKLMDRENVHFGEFSIEECDRAIELLKKASFYGGKNGN